MGSNFEALTPCSAPTCFLLNPAAACRDLSREWGFKLNSLRAEIRRLSAIADLEFVVLLLMDFHHRYGSRRDQRERDPVAIPAFTNFES